MIGRRQYGCGNIMAPEFSGGGKLFGGATASGSASQDSFQAEPGFQINSGGQRQENNEYQVDGSRVNGNSRDGIANLTPEPDTIQELRFSDAAFTSEPRPTSVKLYIAYITYRHNLTHPPQ